MILTRGSSMAQSVIVARWLDPYRVGVFSILSYVLSLAGAFTDIGLPAAAIKLVAECRAGRRKDLKTLLFTVFVAMLTLAGLAATLLFFAADRLALVYHEAALAPLFKLGALLLILSLLGGLLSGILQGLQRIEVLAALGPVKGFTALLVTLLLLPSMGLTGILMASMIAEAMAWFLAYRPFSQAVSQDPSERMRFSWDFLSRGFSLGVPIFLSGLILWGTPLLVRSFLAQTRGYQEVGLFQVADSFGRLLLLLPAAVSVPFMPAVSERAAVEPHMVFGLARAGIRWTILAALPFGLFFFLSAERLIGFVYGASFAGAGSLGSLLILAAFLQSVSVIVWSFLVGTGKVWPGFTIQMASQTLLLALTMVLVPRHGLVGLGVATIVASAAGLLLGLAYLRRRFDLSLKGNGPLLATSLLGWCTAGVLWSLGWAGFLPAIVLAVFCLVMEARYMTNDERRRIREILRFVPFERGAA